MSADEIEICECPLQTPSPPSTSSSSACSSNENEQVNILSNDNYLNNECSSAISVYAVRARRLCVKFDRFSENFILDNFSITVPVGKIFGILGPSGCGKTTFLKCLLGIIKPVSGSITAFGYAPGSFESGIPGRGVGYMPQDISLQGNLTIEEVLKFFGQLNYVDKFVLDKEIDYLIKTLDLPEGKRLISQLSVGQQRRVSYACALVHRPRLVILDEPTVGVDPILRESIWKHLTQLTRENITIIVTTHYIEEMRKASNIAFMKNGRLLIQNEPNVLLKFFCTDSLDQVFYRLCVKKEKSKLINNNKNSNNNNSHNHQDVEEIINKCNEINNVVYNDFNDDESNEYCKQRKNTRIGKLPIQYRKFNFTLKCLIWLMNVFHLTKKLFIQLKRSPEQVALSIILPTIVITIFCVCVGETPHDIKVAVVNEDKEFNISDQFINSLSSFILEKHDYNDLETALKSTKELKNFAVLHIPKNFSKSFLYRYDYRLHGRKLDDRLLNQSLITYYADLSHKPLYMTTKRILEVELIRFIENITLGELKFKVNLNSPPIKLTEPLYSRYIFGDYAGWRDFETSGILLLLTYTLSCLTQTLALIEDKRDKIFDRIYSTGITEMQIILSHILARFLTTQLIIASLYIVSVHVFLLPSVGSTFWTLMLLTLQGVAGMANGIFVSGVTTNTVAVAVVMNGILLTLFFVGGILWPFEGLPYWFKWLSGLTPMSRPVESLRSLLLRGWGITHSTVYDGFFVTIGWIIFFIIASKIAFNINKKIN